jgi:hypothetical protein
MDALRVAFKSSNHQQVCKHLPALKLQPLTSEESLELFTAASLSFLALNDLQQFEKHATLVRTLLAHSHNDAALLVVGLLLVHFLATDRIGDFHVELHLLPTALLSHRLIQYPVQLERSIMEGNYAKALNTSRPQEFEAFVGSLNEAISVRAREVMAAALQHKSSDIVDARAEASQSLKTLLGYAQDLERIV